jgi:hypothetical protein
MVAMITATITRHMPVHPRQRFGIGAMPIRAITLRYPNARFRGGKLFSNFGKVRVRLAARETVIEPIGLNPVSAGLVREHLESIEVRYWLSLRVERLDADVTGTSVKMGVYTMPDCGFVPPGYHGIQKPIAAAACQILVAKT